MLFLILLHLLFAAFRSQSQIFRIVDLIIVDASHRHLDGARRDVVNEFAVVADHHHGLATLDEEIFQPSDTLDVEVVRRFVEEQHVGIFAAASWPVRYACAIRQKKIRRLTVEVRALKSQSEQRFLHVFLEVGHVNRIELLAHGGHLLNQCHIFIALVVGALRQLLVDCLNFRLHLVEVCKRLRGFFKHRAPVFRHEVLGKIGNRCVFSGLRPSRARLAHACQNLEQRALSRAVLSHQGNAVFVVDNK